MTEGMPPMDAARQTARFRPWELALLAMLGAVFCGSSYFYLTDFPILRTYVFGLQPAGSLLQIGTLQIASGRVRRQEAGESEFRNIAVGTPLYNLDTIVTGADVRAEILLKDGGRIELAPSTMVKLQFDAGLSLAGITRRANVQLVSGAVSGEAKSHNIVVTTTSGKKTSFRESPKLVIEEKQAPPLKLAPALRPVPVPSATLAAAPAPVMATPSPSPTLEASKPESIQLSGLMPAPGERLSVPAGSPSARRELRISWKTSAPRLPLTLRIFLQEAQGRRRQVLETSVANRSGSGVFLASLKKPGGYDWEFRDPRDGSLLHQSSFALDADFEAIDLLNPLVGGMELKSNQLQGRITKDFGGVTLRWKPYAGARRYRVRLFRDASAREQLLDREVDTSQYTFNRNKVYTGKVFYQVAAELPSGFRVKSRLDHYEFVFMPPELVMPLNGATLSSGPGPGGAPGSILFTWKKTLFTENYELEVASDQGFSKPLFKKKVQENFLAIPTPDSGAYYWRVRSISQGAVSQPSSPHALVIR